LIHKDVSNELRGIQNVENRPLEMCMDVPYHLKLAKLITQPTRLNAEGLLQSTHQVILMKDGKRSTEVAKVNDVHVKPKGACMLTQRDVSSKELNLLKRKSELASANGQLTVSTSQLLVEWMRWV
jgi:precorrin-2 methylase